MRAVEFDRADRWAKLLAGALALVAPLLLAQPAADPPEQPADLVDESADLSPEGAAMDTAESGEPAEAIVVDERPRPEPEVIENVVDEVLRVADLPAQGNTVAHFIVAGGFLLLALLARRVLIKWLFRFLHRLARRTHMTFDEFVLPAVEGTLRGLILVHGVAGALMVLKLPPAAEQLVRWGYLVAVSLILLVFAIRFADALVDQAKYRAERRQLTVVTFIPWIRRIVLTVVFVFGSLMIAQWLGGDVRSFLAGLGIGGLAVALAAQDTLANVFGSVVVAADQPFRVGEFVQIGAHSGTVEDMGLRSTRLRAVQGNLIVIPNQTVAKEPIVNLGRFVRRRVEQTLGFTYDAKPEQLVAMVEEIRTIVQSEEEVDSNSVMVQFTDFGASSLNIWLVYGTRDPDFVAHLKLKQRINVAIMESARSHGLSFAFPTQSLHIESWPSSSITTDSQCKE